MAWTEIDSGLTSALATQVVPGPITINGNLTVSGTFLPAEFAGVRYVSPSGLTDGTDKAAVTAAIAALTSGTVFLGPGNFTISGDGPTINKNGITIAGVDESTTLVFHAPTADGQAAFHFTRGATAITLCGIRDMTITSFDTTRTKIAVDAIDARLFRMTRVRIGPIGAWTGNSSEGLRLSGRDLNSIEHCNISADIPARIRQNPNAANTLEDADVTHFAYTNFAALAGQYCYLVDSTAQLSNLLSFGCHFTNGAGIMFWHNSTSPGVAYNVTFTGCERGELLTGGNLIDIDLAGSGGLRGLIVNDLSGGGAPGDGGIKLRGPIAHVSISRYGFLNATGTAIDADGIDQIGWNDCFFIGGSTLSLANMTRLSYEGAFADGTAPGHPSERWVANTNTKAIAGYAMGIGGGTTGATGVNINGMSGVLANGASIQVKFGNGAGKAGIISAFAIGATKHAGIVAYIATDTAIAIGTPAGDGEVTVAPGSPGAGKFNVHSTGSGAVISINNNVGESVDYGAAVKWI